MGYRESGILEEKKHDSEKESPRFEMVSSKQRHISPRDYESAEQFASVKEYFDKPLSPAEALAWHAKYDPMIEAVVNHELNRELHLFGVAERFPEAYPKVTPISTQEQTPAAVQEKPQDKAKPAGAFKTGAEIAKGTGSSKPARDEQLSKITELVRAGRLARIDRAKWRNLTEAEADEILSLAKDMGA